MSGSSESPTLEEWADEVSASVTRHLESWDVGFGRNHSVTVRKFGSLLWSAPPISMARRFPLAGIEESFGEILSNADYNCWIHVRWEDRRAVIAFDTLADLDVALTQNAAADAASIRRVLDECRTLLETGGL